MGRIEKVTILKTGAKAMRGRKAEHPKMEGQLLHEFKEMENQSKDGGFVR